MRIPRSHPRYHSLITREKIVKGLERGIVAKQGLIAQGRGEAFDYLLGEKTLPFAFRAERAASALLLSAERPVISVNGNVAALVPREIVELARKVGAKLEVNLFYYSAERARRIKDLLERYGGEVLTERNAKIPGLRSSRGMVCRDGIYSADVVFVPLEDGDRTEALVRMGKKVVAVDLNPLSRTAMSATITIVDNVVRAVPNMIRICRDLRKLDRKKLVRIVEEYDNEGVLKDALRYISTKFS